MCRLAWCAAAAAVFAAGCQQVAWYEPAPDQGALVANGRRLGVAYRISDDRKPGQSYVVLDVRHAFTVEPRRGERHAIVRVEAILVNRAPVAAKLDLARTTLEIGGRAFRPARVRRYGWHGGLDKSDVASGTYARFDLYYDLGPYRPSWEYAPAPPVIGGIPLGTMRAFTVNWRAVWAGEVRVGRTRFVLDTIAPYAGNIEEDHGSPARHGGRVWGLTDEDEMLLMGR